MLQILIDHPLILLFLVSTISYLIGRIKIKGSSLGVAAALFVGLAFGALRPIPTPVKPGHLPFNRLWLKIWVLLPYYVPAAFQHAIV